MNDDKCRAVCQEIRDCFEYFSEWDLPLGFEYRLNEALGLPPPKEWLAPKLNNEPSE